MTADKVNDYGVMFRFITPVLVTIAIFSLSNLAEDIKDLRACIATHLEVHRVLDVALAERVAKLETIISHNFVEGGSYGSR
jgi:hypothetical protein